MISVEEAKQKFGELTTGGAVKTYLEFERKEGTWKPVYDVYCRLIGYRLEEEC